MKISMFLPFHPDRRWEVARQIGVTHAIVKLAPELTGFEPPYNIDVLVEAQRRFQDAGFVLEALEGDPMDMSRIKLGLPGRDEDIARYQTMLANMGELGIPLLCYNFMAGIGWYRTRTDVLERGGAITSSFDEDQVPHDVPVKITPEQVWENYRYFISRVLPVAEKAGVKMGLHPDDPPIPMLNGYGRFLTSADAYRKVLALSDSPSHGITFCQANFFAMGEDVPALIREWGKRIFFVHFRDIRGQAGHFVEAFHDNGSHDMAELLRVYREIGFDGPIRTDHAPSLAGEGEGSGYEMMGHIFAIGYLKGILDAL
ncbi:MAG: mannonate dehydratase [Planctomycetia bacterium]|nr:mannonate dehydratase [Planctomycetia bacterium]